MVPPRYGHQADKTQDSSPESVWYRLFTLSVIAQRVASAIRPLRKVCLVNTVVSVCDDRSCPSSRSDWSLHMADPNAAEAAQIQANRAISTGKLHALPHFHTRPINVVVSHGSQGRTGFEAGFPLRCFQRLSFPYLATQRCSWRNNWYTSGTFIPVLSY